MSDKIEIKKISKYLLAFCDKNGCYDEMRIDPYQLRDIEYALHYLNLGNVNGDYGRLYVIYEDDSWDELKVSKYR